jgi:predicted metal-dependent HD superfamily phosphohydrolase
MDLSILGTKEAEFDDTRPLYVKGMTLSTIGRSGRGGALVLRRFLARDRVYHSDLFGILYEDATRRNLRRSLEQLEK